MLPEEYERILNWFYDQAAIGDIELKATCAPHYFRVVRQRRAEERKQEGYGAAPAAVAAKPAIGATEMTMPGSTGLGFKTDYEKFGKSGIRHDGVPHPHGHPGGDPNAMNAMTKGCLAGTGVCFLSFEGEVFPCGYLPAVAGDLRKQPFAEVWNNSKVFADLRDTEKLEGKCGCCEFRNICMGCRARAYAATGNYMASGTILRLSAQGDGQQGIAAAHLGTTATARIVSAPLFAASVQRRSYLPAAFGAGIVMSMGVTGPRAASCFSNRLALPTTSTFSSSLWTYFLATRCTSAEVTFSTPARYCSRKSFGYP